MADVLSTFKTMLSASPELAKTPLLTVDLANTSSQQNGLDPNPGPANKAAAQSTAMSLILLGVKNGADSVVQMARQPQEPEPRL